MEEWQPLRHQPIFLIVVGIVMVALAAAAWQGDDADVWVAGAGAALVLALAGFGGLRTRVGAAEVVLTWIPVWRRRISRADIEEIEAVKVRPLREFGGWGIRLGRRGIMYSVAGRDAVRLKIRGKRDVYIGTQDPAALESALRL